MCIRARVDRSMLRGVIPAMVDIADFLLGKKQNYVTLDDSPSTGLRVVRRAVCVSAIPLCSPLKGMSTSSSLVY